VGGLGKSAFFLRPIGLITAIVSTVIMFAWLGWHVLYTHKEFETLRESVIQIEKNSGDIIDLHQKLIFYIRLASTTDWSWTLEKYQSTKVELDYLLSGDAGTNGKRYPHHSPSYKELRDIDLKALRLLENKNRQAAVSLLFSDKYNLLMDQFRQDTNSRLQAIQQSLQQQFAVLEERDITSLAIALIIFLISLLIWFYLYRNLLEWQKRVFNEIQHRESVEEELYQAQKMEAIGQLSAGIAHDFNNALAVITGYAELAESEAVDSVGLKRYLKNIRQAAYQANDITRALLTFSRRNSSLQNPLELVETIDETFGLIKELLPASITLIDGYSSQRDVWIMGNKSQIQQVILNLAINSKDAMPQGGDLSVALSIEENKSALTKTIARLSITDTGTGIDPETLKKIRDPYFTTKPRMQGTGLGLSIVDGIIKAHSGRLSIKSTSGVGSSFTIEMEVIDHDYALPINEIEHSPGSGESGLIVIMQGQQYARDVLVSSLKLAGYRIEIADPNGAQNRMYWLQENSFDLLIADYEAMGDIGLSYLRKLREIGNVKPVILLTESVNGNKLDELETMTIILNKPVSVADINKLVARFLNNNRTKD
jgi:signal transduction histidine kinase/CheY-like chemotaxis protein